MIMLDPPHRILIRTHFQVHIHIYMGAAGGSMSVPSPWLSPQRPGLRIVLTMLRKLRTQLARDFGPSRPGAAARKRLASAEGKQAQDNEVVDDDDVDNHHDNEDTITIIDD